MEKSRPKYPAWRRGGGGGVIRWRIIVRKILAENERKRGALYAKGYSFFFFNVTQFGFEFYVCKPLGLVAPRLVPYFTGSPSVPSQTHVVNRRLHASLMYTCFLRKPPKSDRCLGLVTLSPPVEYLSLLDFFLYPAFRGLFACLVGPLWVSLFFSPALLTPPPPRLCLSSLSLSLSKKNCRT